MPQNPPPGSQWVRGFPDTDTHAKYVHRLGNLVLLSHRKNSRAQNYDFRTKKERYFRTRDGVSPFALTAQVLRERKWTPRIIERRQAELLGKLTNLWWL